MKFSKGERVVVDGTLIATVLFQKEDGTVIVETGAGSYPASPDRVVKLA